MQPELLSRIGNGSNFVSTILSPNTRWLRRLIEEGYRNDVGDSLALI